MSTSVNKEGEHIELCSTGFGGRQSQYSLEDIEENYIDIVLDGDGLDGGAGVGLEQDGLDGGAGVGTGGIWGGLGSGFETTEPISPFVRPRIPGEIMAGDFINYAASNIGRLNKDYTYKHWMTILHYYIRDKGLKDIVIPGTHDSGSYSCSGRYGISPYGEAGDMVRRVFNMGCFHSCFVLWAKNQGGNILDQLNAGIRYFDFRVCVSTVDGVLRVHHTLYGGDYDTIFTHIKIFLDATDKEMVILNFRHFLGEDGGEMTILDHRLFCSKLENFLRDYLVPVGMAYSTIREIIKSGDGRRRVVVIYGGSNDRSWREIINKLDKNYILDGGAYINNQWANAQTPGEMVEFLNAKEHFNAFGRKFFELQTVLTPNNGIIARGTCFPCCCPNSTRALAAELAPVFERWFCGGRGGGGRERERKKINIVSLDWIGDNRGLILQMIVRNFSGIEYG